MFLDLLERVSMRYELGIHAYVLMGNHYHLLVHTRQANLSKAMQWLGVSYAGWFNRKHNRCGHLFQGRFKSFLIEDDEYFTTMCYYIHANPLRAGIVKNLMDYEWSSGRAYAAAKNAPQWLKTELMLCMSSGSRKRFWRLQAEYLGQQLNPLADLRHGLYLGSEEFADECRQKARPEQSSEKPQVRRLLRRRDPKLLALEIMGVLGEDSPAQQLKNCRCRKRPIRDMTIYLMTLQGVYTNAEIGEVFGVGYTAVTGSAKRGKHYLSKDKKIKRKAESMLSGI